MAGDEERERLLEAGRKKLERFRAKSQKSRPKKTEVKQSLPEDDTRLDPIAEAPAPHAVSEPAMQRAAPEPSMQSAPDTNDRSSEQTAAPGPAPSPISNFVANYDREKSTDTSSQAHIVPVPGNADSHEVDKDADAEGLARWLSDRDKRMKVVMAAALELEGAIAVVSYAKKSRFSGGDGSGSNQLHSIMRSAHDVVLRLEGNGVKPAEPKEQVEFPVVSDIIDDLRQLKTKQATEDVDGDEPAPKGVNGSPAEPETNNRQPPNGGPEKPEPLSVQDDTPEPRQFDIPTLQDLQEGMSVLQHQNGPFSSRAPSTTTTASMPDFESPFERVVDHLSASELRQRDSHASSQPDRFAFAFEAIEGLPREVSSLSTTSKHSIQTNGGGGGGGGMEGTMRELMFENSSLSRRVEAQANALIEMSVEKERWAAERGKVQQREVEAQHKWRNIVEEKEELKVSLQSVIEGLLQENNILAAQVSALHAHAGPHPPAHQQQQQTPASYQQQQQQQQQTPASYQQQQQQQQEGNSSSSNNSSMPLPSALQHQQALAEGGGVEGAHQSVQEEGGGRGGGEVPRADVEGNGEGSGGREERPAHHHEGKQGEENQARDRRSNAEGGLPTVGATLGGSERAPSRVVSVYNAQQKHEARAYITSRESKSMSIIPILMSSPSSSPTSSPKSAQSRKRHSVCFGSVDERVFIKDNCSPPTSENSDTTISTTQNDSRPLVGGGTSPGKQATGPHDGEGSGEESRAGVGGMRNSGPSAAEWHPEGVAFGSEEVLHREGKGEGGEEGKEVREARIGFGALAHLLFEAEGEERGGGRGAQPNGEGAAHKGEGGFTVEEDRAAAAAAAAAAAVESRREAAAAGGHGRAAPTPRPFPPELLAHPGDKDIQITLRHLDGFSQPKAPTPILYSLVDTVWGVVSLRPVRSLVFGGAASAPADSEDPW